MKIPSLFRTGHRVGLPVVCLVALWSTATEPPTAGSPIENDLAPVVDAWLQTLDEPQREAALFAFDDDERRNWHFIPRERKGLSLGQMDDESRHAAHALLRSILSTAGYLKSHAIIQLERVLFEIESRPGRPASHRDPQRYWFSVFGDLHGAAWGLRIEGHHLSVNLTCVDGKLSATPFFLGANPGIVPSGPLAGLGVLAEERQRGRDLIESLRPALRERARLADEVPADVFLIPGRDSGFETREGVAASEMNAAEQARLRDLLRVYLSNLHPDLALSRQTTLDEDLDSIHFGWIGSTSEGSPLYYRVAGVDFAIEYDNVQNGANHPHAVWREYQGDFGQDLLRQHYREHHPRE